MGQNKPQFFQAVLMPIEGDVLAQVYPHLVAKQQVPTMAERMGSEEATCEECGDNRWFLLPQESIAVVEGGKPYIECLNCGHQTHL